MDGFNFKKQRDNFSFKENIVASLMEIKKIFTRPKLQVKIKDVNFNVIGHLGMYHAIIDITGANNINIGDEVILNLAPLYTNTNIRREYV